MSIQVIFTALGVAIFIQAIHAIKGKPAERLGLIALSILYCAGLVFFTMFQGERGSYSGIQMRIPVPIWYEALTGSFGKSSVRSILNVFLFIPFGYLLPQIPASKGKTDVSWWKTVLAGLFVSLVIETAQLLLQRGVFELDDLVKNTIGTGIGYVFYWALYIKEP